ncbi:hypothetical protein QOZ80_5AG0362280 [Eleusine coracana subsp. coracana]|nr:hypothetical protein QOZ80_5AG0362280 [Eleusine coracana subsp. coracana]
MSSRPGRRRLDPDSEPPLRGNRRRPLVPKPPPPRGDRRRPRGPEPLPSGDLRRSQPQCAPQLQQRPDDAGDGVDLISGLPNDLLREVLARLGCARAAAQTSTLSRRWLDLWRHIQHRYLYFRGVTPSKLLDILGQVPSSDLALLHISVPPNRTCEHACVASLLRTAASLRPVEFFFSAEVDCISVELPNFHQAEAISLELESGIHGYQLDTAGDFPVLERLFVSGCYFNFTDLISRCPRLRVLRVSTSGYRTYSDSITVHSTTLRELNVGGSGLRSGIVIKAPVLERYDPL